MSRVAVLAVLALPALAPLAGGQPFKLAPAVALEAEDFTAESGWKVVRNGQGNYMVDIKTIASDTSLVCIAPVPVCLVTKNWKEF